VVSAFIATAFAQDTAETASAQGRSVADQIRPKVPRLATLMDDAEHDVLAYIGLRPFLPQTAHRTVCRLRRTGANFPKNTARSCTPRTQLSV
jgi:hypothetical protein